MTAGELRLLSFIESRLESLLRRPAAWGSHLSVEDQVLQLLELRRVLIVPSLGERDTHQLMRAYTRFIADVLDDATPEPLAIQLEHRGRSEEFTTLLARFVDRELIGFVATSGSGEPEPELSRADPLEVTDRLFAQLEKRAEAQLRHGPAARRPIEFPSHGRGG